MIEQLPDVPFRLIFSFLSYEDRFSLRRACKGLKWLVDGQNSGRLFVFFFNCYPFHARLFGTSELVYYADSYRVVDFERFVPSKCQENLKMIRKLILYFESVYPLNFVYSTSQNSDQENSNFEKSFNEVWRLEINLEHLNFFEQVEHVKIKVRQISHISIAISF